MNVSRSCLAIAGALLLAGCGGLPRSLRDEIAAEKDRLPQAERQLRNARQTVHDDMAHAPDLFAGTPVATAWPARLQSAESALDRARNDLRQFDKLHGADRARAEQLLHDERSLRESALRDSDAIASEANSWLDFQQNIPHYLAAMQHEYDRIHGADPGPLSKTVAQAEQDWPAKKAVLDDRLARLRQSSEGGETQWRATEQARQDAAAGKATGPEIAMLIQANQTLVRDEASLTQGADELRASCGQLYDAWDKILTDLDVAHRGGDTVYSEKLNIVRTHFVDVAAKQTQVSHDDRWVEVSPSAYRSVENDLGMAIAHKDAGQFDSEAQTTVQPAGFAYIASPAQGSNQYGYWSHSGGQSVWTFLPQYLIMRELLWGHGYHPVYVNEYDGYQTARRFGRTYYGQETPSSPPKYGSHGTFTEERYAGSRYVQSGGFKGSAYSSSRESGAPSSSARSGFSRPEATESSEGKRFGSGSGRRFGSPRSAPRSFGHSFGHRR